MHRYEVYGLVMLAVLLAFVIYPPLGQKVGHRLSVAINPILTVLMGAVFNVFLGGLLWHVAMGFFKKK